MEKILNRYEKEYMKMAMLKHEETFREQVYELHRLYQIQKILMKNVSKQKSVQENNNNSNKTAYKQQQQQKQQSLNLETECNRDTDAEDVAMEEDESNLELTLGPSCYSRSKRDSTKRSESFSSSSSESKGKEISSREALLGLKWNNNNIEQQQPQQFIRQDRLNNPPWLFQPLSLNMTS